MGQWRALKKSKNIQSSLIKGLNDDYTDELLLEKSLQSY
jgi:hypothetical protein